MILILRDAPEVAGRLRLTKYTILAGSWQISGNIGICRKERGRTDVKKGAG